MDRTKGHLAEIEFLYRQHGAALVLFASAITGERSRAQAVHQVFLKFMANGNLSRAEDKKAYLFACISERLLSCTYGAISHLHRLWVREQKQDLADKLSQVRGLLQ